jgi:hypothetical protein
MTGLNSFWDSLGLHLGHDMRQDELPPSLNNDEISFFWGVRELGGAHLVRPTVGQWRGPSGLELAPRHERDARVPRH